MKQLLYSLFFAAAALIAGCSTSSDEAIEIDGPGQEGHVQFSAQASADVESLTRAKVNLPTSAIPSEDKFSLHVTGTYPDDMGQPQPYDQFYTSISKYTSPKMRRATYTATISCGDIETEGKNSACFAGTADFTILARKTISSTITASLQNSALTVVFDPWFNKYYKNAKITIRTESGNSFTYDSTSTGLVFIKPATQIFMKGEAVKSQTNTEVIFPETLVGTSAARSLHTLTIKASEAGSGGLVIDYDDTFTEVEEEIIELNPDAK